jgi:double-stranded uracil-DNA glycosylase
VASPSGPTREQLEAARGREIADVLAPGLDVVFVGINPGLWSGATGHHFARPGNRFWRALQMGGFTRDLVSPFDDARLPSLGLGITNLVARSTATAVELKPDELRSGAERLVARLEPLSPRAIAILGIGAYRTAFAVPTASLGRQADPFAGAERWVLPNPSGLNAHYQVDALAERFAEVRRSIGRPTARTG